MVRYPKKTEKLLVPDVKSQVHAPTKVVAGPRVEELNAHIHELEEKLKNLEEAQAATSEPVPVVPPIVKKNIVQQYWLIGLAVLLIIPLYMGYQYWQQPPYTATIGFSINNPAPVKGVNIAVPRSIQEALLLSDAKVSSSWLSLNKHARADGFVLNAKGHGLNSARETAVGIVNAFRTKYVQERKLKINEALANIEHSISDHRKRLEKIVELLNMYKAPEQCLIVSASIKKSLDGLLLTKAPLLEQESAKLQEQIGALPAIPKDSKGLDQVALQGLMMQLTDMELKKYLVATEDVGAFDGGMQPIKAKIAGMINTFATQTNADATLLIKAIFVQAKVDALEALLNKRYGVLGSFVGRMGEYAGLKAEFEKRYISLENAYIMKEQLKPMLLQDIATEMVVDMPVIVIKK